MVRRTLSRLIADDAPARQRVELLLARAAALAATGRFADSHEALLESVALASDEPVDLRLKVTTACASASTSSAGTRMLTRAC